MDYTVMETQLKDEYREVFSKAQVYATLKHIADDVMDEKMTELYDLLLTAQTDGKPVNKLIGRDENKFLKNFFGDYTFIERLKRLPANLYNVAWVVFVLECIEAIAADDTIKNFFNIKSDVSGYGVGALTAILLYLISDCILAPILLKKKKDGSNYRGQYFPLIVIALFVVFIGIGTHFSDDISFILPTAPFIIGSGLYIVIYLIVRSVWRLKNYGSLRNTRRQIEQDSYYRNLQNRDMEKAILQGWQARYERLSKKGKVTAEGYLDKLKKEEKLQKNFTNIGIPLLFVAVSAFFVIDVALDSTWYDTLIFIALIGTIEYFIARWTVRSEKKQAAIRTRLLDDCEKQSISLPEYIKQRLADF